MSFDLEDVRRQAAASLAENNVEEARGIYMGATMDINDCLQSLDENDTEMRAEAFQYAVQLWLAYAGMEIQLRQWKKAVAVFDEAVADPFASKSGLIYQAYSSYCRDRKRLPSAQKILIKGLSSALNQSDVNMLWKEFLEMMRAEGSPSLTLLDLHAAIIEQLGEAAVSLSQPDADTLAAEKEVQVVPAAVPAVAVPPAAMSPAAVPPAVTRAAAPGASTAPKVLVRVEDYDLTLEPGAFDLKKAYSGISSQGRQYNLDILTHLLDFERDVSTRDDLIHFQAGSLMTEGSLKPEELVEKHQKRPPCLFTAPTLEPMLGGAQHLDPLEAKMLEEYLGAPLSSLNEPGETQGGKVLDLLEALWLMQALKERHFDVWFTKLMETHTKDEQRLQSIISQKEIGLKERDPVRMKHQREMKAFYDRCTVQQCILDATLNKSLYELLAIQQHALASIGLPFFTHGFAKHLLNIVYGKPYDKKTLDIIEKQKAIVAALLSVRVGVEGSICPPARFIRPNRPPQSKKQGVDRVKTKRRRSNSYHVDPSFIPQGSRPLPMSSGGGHYGPAPGQFHDMPSYPPPMAMPFQQGPSFAPPIAQGLGSFPPQQSAHSHHHRQAPPPLDRRLSAGPGPGGFGTSAGPSHLPVTGPRGVGSAPVWAQGPQQQQQPLLHNKGASLPLPARQLPPPIVQAKPSAAPAPAQGEPDKKAAMLAKLAGMLAKAKK